MRCLFFILLISSLTVLAQNSASPPTSSQSGSVPNSQGAGSSSTRKDKPPAPDLSPPRSDSIPAAALEEGTSSSKDTQVDLSAPANDSKTHPEDAASVSDAEIRDAARGGEVLEFHVWNPHRAAKDVEVGDFYFKRKNYVAAEDRYREALYYKNNDATATFRLAVCLEKMNRPDDARQEYESYLRILPHGPEAQAAQKAIARLKAATAGTQPPQ
jgi:tetratricopeptide (TPR) repeat protein